MVEQDVMFDYMMRFKPVIFLGRQVIEPPVECIEDWRLWIELSRRMGYSEHFPWQTVLEFYEYLLAPSGISVKDLIENPTGIWYMDPNKTQRYLGKGFLTPSGKVEIYSEAMKRLGYDPLPTYIESPESLVSRPDLAGKYPFIMLNGTREVEFRNSGLHNIPRLLKRMPKPLVEINSISAEKLGIADGDMVVIESLRGSIEMKAKVTNDIHPKVISLPRGWPGANSNYLSGDEDRDPVTGYCGYRTQLCSVRKSKP
jgi:anaerobic selenocysteine-containing dehydrogenase